MDVLRRNTLSTPRLLVVGLVVFGAACHRQQPASAPPPKLPPSQAPAPKPQPAAPPAGMATTRAPTLLPAIIDKYAATWYHNMTVVQKTTVSLPSGAPFVQTWYEAGQLPGRLRIDTDIAS